MSNAKLPGDFEVELPGEWPPCPTCDSVVRTARATLQHRHIGFFCGRSHRQNWVEDNGDAGLWIKHYHFWPGGDFEGLIPSHMVSVPKAADADRRFDINERRKDWIHTEQRACVVCDVSPMRDWHDRKKLLFWLKDHHQDVFNAVMGVINVLQPKPNLSTWFGEVLKSKVEVAQWMNRTIQDSFLQADHGVPKNALKMLWDSWDGEMRRIATSTLAFGKCRPHNNGKSRRLPSRDELLRHHIQLNHGGNERLARENRPQWDALHRVLDSIDANRAAYDATLKLSARGAKAKVNAPDAADEEP